jgi:indolepyruvate ferredoxin oxidoreductase alpha subunit
MKLVERELGPHHVSADIGCHLFSILPPFHIGNTTMGYGLGTAGASAFSAASGKRAIAMMGDGGFWHNGLTSGVANAVFNRSDNLTIVVDNNYTSATGGQDLLSSRATNPTRSTGHAIEQAVRGVGVKWVKTMRRTYDVAGMRDALREALTTTEKGPEGADRAVGVPAQPAAPHQAADQEGDRGRRARRARALRRRCRHLHRRPFVHPAVGVPVAVDQAEPGPAAHRPGRNRPRQLRRLRRLRRGLARGRALPVVLQGAHRHNPSGWDRFAERVRGAVIGWLQRRDARARERLAF